MSGVQEQYSLAFNHATVFSFELGDIKNKKKQAQLESIYDCSVYVLSIQYCTAVSYEYSIPLFANVTRVASHPVNNKHRTYGNVNCNDPCFVHIYLMSSGDIDSRRQEAHFLLICLVGMS